MATRPRPHKVAIHGLAFSGKTSLCMRVKANTFNPDGCAATVLCDYLVCTVVVGAPTSSGRGRPMALQIYDTAGQEMFESGVALLMRDLRGSLVVFSLTDRRSYARAQLYAREVLAVSHDAVIVLVGNKLDLVDPACADTRHEDEEADALGPCIDLAATATARAAARAAPAGGSAARIDLFDAPQTYGRLATEHARRFGLERDADADADAGSDSDADSDLYSDASATSLDAYSGAVAGTTPLGAAPRRAVATSDAAAYAAANGYSYVETSALSGTRVIGAFRLLAERIAAAHPLVEAGAGVGTHSSVALGAMPDVPAMPSYYAADVDATLAALDVGLAETAPRKRECAC